MILVLYDIGSVRTQTKLRQYLERYGTRLQYSVYQIFATPPEIKEVLSTIRINFVPNLETGDSIVVIPLSTAILDKCQVYGDKGFANQPYLEI